MRRWLALFRRAAGGFGRLIAGTAATCAVLGAALALLVGVRAEAAPLEGIHKIQHVVVIMQENRSFDSYFGTFPRADGIPGGTCVPDPLRGSCTAPFHDPSVVDYGGPHGTKAARLDIDAGKMDGFVVSAENGNGCTSTSTRSKCLPCEPSHIEAGQRCIDAMGYHDAREIPNYWTYAKDFVLQDHMFESALSWSRPEHNFLVSGWSARCPQDDPNPLDCFNSLELGIGYGPSTDSWTDVTYLLDRDNVSWRYYVFEGSEPDCQSDEAVTCAPVEQGPATPGIWNPLPYFTDVKEDGQLGNMQSLDKFYTAVHEKDACGLPNVSWIDPNKAVSEHPTASIASGQAYVTTLVNAIMRGPCWESTAVFLSWDDWGGFYDHVVPPAIDKNGYGLRVPGLVISPYAKSGYIDHQQLSHDAYLKFIEDDFLEGARLNPRTDGRPDERPAVREEARGLGDLANDFNFAQPPRPPVLLATHPAPGPASTPPGEAEPPSVETLSASPVAQTSATLNATVDPNGAAVGGCYFEYGTSTSYGSSVSCGSLPGSGSGAVEVSAQLAGLGANQTYHFRIVASGEGGSSTGADRTLTTPPEPPSVQTLSASLVAQMSATLNATVDPNGAAVGSCVFEYGTSVFYEASAPCAPALEPGVGPVAVSVQLEGLAANGTYHFRIVAGNEGGIRTGADETFTTLPEPPAVSGLTPGTGPEAGGTAVAIKGEHLAAASAVTFGSRDATSFIVNSENSIVAVSPPGTGAVDVVVTTRGGASTTSASDRFNYLPGPAITQVKPIKGPVDGGTAVTVTGANFVAGETNLSFGASSAAGVVVNSATSLTALSPSEPAGAVDVRATTPGGTSAITAVDRFKFAPTVTGVSPSTGSTAGGGWVTLTGTGFAVGDKATIVRFGNTRSASTNCVSTTECVVVSPAQGVGTVDVTATVNGIASAKTTPDRFTYF